jgi:putative chitinase
MNLKIFFDHVRKFPFRGRLTASQVDGMTRILTYRTLNYPQMPVEQLAYLLATAYHETGRKMIPVREGGGERYLQSKKYYPWVGEGLVQVTWEQNARKFGAQKPGDCMTWPVALRALFEGCLKGMFTGKRLSDYINDKQTDFINARRVVNGTDKATLIAGYAEAFLEALQAK